MGAPTGVFNVANSQVDVASVDTTNDTITLTGASGYRTGDAIVYRKTSAQTAVGGLTDGGTYYAIEVPGQGNMVKLATSAENARAGTAIDLTSSGAGKIQPLGKATPTINNADVNEAGLVSKRKATPEIVSVELGAATTAAPFTSLARSWY